MLNFCKVDGDSMEPTILSGSYVISLKKIKYNIGDIVVVTISEDLNIIKRIVSICDRKIKLSGDNTLKSSSLCEPWYSQNQILGKMIFNSSLFNKILKTKEPSKTS
jgi:phage repressor protein C with HTH and peptisase S24 domain